MLGATRMQELTDPERPKCKEEWIHTAGSEYHHSGCGVLDPFLRISFYFLSSRELGTRCTRGYGKKQRFGPLDLVLMATGGEEHADARRIRKLGYDMHGIRVI